MLSELDCKILVRAVGFCWRWHEWVFYGVDEATAYKWAGQLTAGCTAEPHKTQQCADLIASALVEATVALERQISELTRKNCELQEKLDEYENAYKFIVDDRCFGEEKHCACAPILRAKAKELEAENGRLFGKLQKIMMEVIDDNEGCDEN